MDAPDLALYELAGADPELRFSPHAWKTRMALAHKGLAARGIPWRFAEREVIAAHGASTVPVLLADSWAIAVFLEERFPERPSLFGGDAALHLARFVNRWTDIALMPLISRVILLDIYDRLDEGDRAYFRSSREARFGRTLEEYVAADPTADLAALRIALRPARAEIADKPFLSGNAPAYADYCLFGAFMWARCASPCDLLAPDDPLGAWRDRLLDAFGGMARAAPWAGSKEVRA